MARKSSGLGERHEKILIYLKQFQDEAGYSPSIRQIGESIGVNSTSLVDYYLKQLEKSGYIERDAHVSRSIRLVVDPSAGNIKQSVKEKFNTAAETIQEMFSIPIAGRIVASAPIPIPTSDLSLFDSESTIDIARSMLPAKENIEELFALEVDGDSMIDAMVNDGDIVIMRRAIQANNGEMVAVWLDDNDETTLKYFFKEDGRIRLQPANPSMNPIYINNPEQVRIMGKVVMVIRQVQG
ncbi:MAG: repressor LexA [Anaerolineaceae bacterium]|nr:repressor LexA [Anaerolineaceae bacterium]